ncbi:MAG TPA: electron transfer flavoprotein subunit beta/FixA family protein [Nitrososphaerales archaeon]|nr:electron transfer flavoprotein subunit beta/FixA family protein [Nitrososphaerales archaeon]
MKRLLVEIIVCFKHVYDETELKIDRLNNRISFEGARTKISDDDKNAIEEAVKLKEKNGGSVIALCVGETSAKKSIKEALAMGCDRARLLSDPLFQECDAIRTAYILSKAIQKIGKYDLVITAGGTTDSYSGIVGPSLAEWLSIPQIAFAASVSLTQNKVNADRSLDEGVETVECDLPALISVSREINQPRFPTLIQIMSAGKKEMIEWNASALGIDSSALESKIVVNSLNVPKSARKKLIFEGSPEESAAKLAEALFKEGIVK